MREFISQVYIVAIQQYIGYVDIKSKFKIQDYNEFVGINPSRYTA